MPNVCVKQEFVDYCEIRIKYSQHVWLGDFVFSHAEEIRVNIRCQARTSWIRIHASNGKFFWVKVSKDFSLRIDNIKVCVIIASLFSQQKWWIIYSINRIILFIKIHNSEMSLNGMNAFSRAMRQGKGGKENLLICHQDKNSSRLMLRLLKLFLWRLWWMKSYS